MAKYRVKEIVGTNQFIIQKRFQINKRKDNPNLVDRFFIFLDMMDNEDSYEWRNLNKAGGYSNAYHTKKFHSFKEAIEIAKKLDADGEEKIHDIKKEE